MLDLMNKLYRFDAVTIDIINALELKLSDAENKINDLYKQIFLDYADWYLEIKEDEMAISKRTDDIDKRRARVKTRLLGVGTATKELLESTANSISGVTVEILFEDMTVIINFLAVENNKYLGVVKKAIAEMIPYHLDLDIRYDHVNWGELKDVTWNAVKDYTWESVSLSVAGTILGGLDDDFD
ncbi:MAG: YmfQ family protein [Clostridiales bacterium]|nr:YmfQ family protein [Clostridiales bacterium]